MTLPRVLEFQLDQVPLLGMIRNEFKFRARMLCIGEFTVDLDDQPATLVLDHIEVPTGGGLRRSQSTTVVPIAPGGTVSVNLVEVTIPFQVFLKTKACAEDPACAPDDYEVAGLQYTLVLSLTVDQGSLCLSFVGVEPGLGPPLPADVLALMQGAVDQICAPFDLTPLQDLLKTSVSIKNAGVSADSDLTRIAFRLEFNEFASPPADSLAAWQAFFDGQIGPHIAGKDWSLLIGHKLFTESVISRFATSLEKKKDKFELDDDTPMSAEWSAGGAFGSGHVQVTFSGQLHDSPCPNDIGIHPVTVDIDLHVDSASPAVIQSEGVITWNAVDSDVELCSFVYGVGFSVISPWITVAVMALGAIIAGGEEPDQEDLDLPSECTAKSDTEFHCGQDVSLPVLQFGLQGALLHLQTLSGSSDGPLLGGSVGWFPYTPGPLLSVTTSPIELGIFSDNSSCSSLHIGYGGGVSLLGYPGSICAVTVSELDDPLHVFTVNPKNSVLPADVEVRFADGVDVLAPDFLQEYWDWQPAPYPCKLLVRTGAGARAILLDAPVKADPNSLQDDLLFERVMCKVAGMLEQTGFLGIPGKFDPHWHVDPPWETLVEVVAVNGRTQLARAETRWTNVEVEAAALTSGSITQRAALTFTRAPLRIQAGAVVETERFGQFEISLDEVVLADLAGRVLNRRGHVDLNVTNTVALALDIPQIELPRQARAMTVLVRMDPGSLRLTGRLRRLGETPTRQSGSRVVALPAAARI